MKIAVIVGTRPDIIKMAPIIKELEKRNVDFFVIHTGQHYDWEMSYVFIEELNLPKPDYYLEVRSGSHGQQTARILERSERVFLEEKPDIVLVLGDTNSALGAALSAAKLHIPIGYIESGCRSFDDRMPEEINRKLIAHMAFINFAPSPLSYINLLLEGIPRYRVFYTGHPIVDLLHDLETRNIIDKYSYILDKFGVEQDEYILATFHRPENVDNKRNLKEILLGLQQVDFPVLIPLHPRTRKNIDSFGFNRYIGKQIKVLLPQPYLSFLALLKNSRLVLTDSGGVQQESAILGIRCITVREGTEWFETVLFGFNELAPPDHEKIRIAVKNVQIRKIPAYSEYAHKLFGTYGVSKRIVDILLNERLLEDIKSADEILRKHHKYGYPFPKLISGRPNNPYILLGFDGKGLASIGSAIGLDSEIYYVILEFISKMDIMLKSI